MTKIAEIENIKKCLEKAAFELHTAWKLCKDNGLEKTAKELADTVLDVNYACEIITKHKHDSTEK